jgi:hypothetical protein
MFKTTVFQKNINERGDLGDLQKYTPRKILDV